MMAPCTHPGTSREVHGARCIVFAVGRVRSMKLKGTKKKRKKSAPPKPRHEIHSRRPPRRTRYDARQHVPRGSPYSHASFIDPGFVEISLACIHTYPRCCCYAACIRFGALFSRQRSFCILRCDMYLRFRGSPVVLDIELSVSAWYQKNRHALYYCARGVFCCCCFLQLTAKSGGVRCAA